MSSEPARIHRRPDDWNVLAERGRAAELIPTPPALRSIAIESVHLGTCPNPPCSSVEHHELPNGARECRRCLTRWMPHRDPVEPLLWEGDQA